MKTGGEKKKYLEFNTFSWSSGLNQVTELNYMLKNLYQNSVRRWA